MRLLRFGYGGVRLLCVPAKYIGIMYKWFQRLQ